MKDLDKDEQIVQKGSMKRSRKTAEYFIKALRDEGLLIDEKPNEVDEILISFLGDLIEMDIESTKRTQVLMSKLAIYRTNQDKD